MNAKRDPMLIELFGRNFRCFRDEFRLSMVAADIEPESDRGIIVAEIEGEAKPLRLLRSVAIYGPNASGKSSVLWAATALSYLIRTSAATASDEGIAPYEPFMLEFGSSSEPVTLGLRAVVNRREYEYVVTYDHSAIQKERLAFLSGGTPRILFDRTAQRVEGEWTKNEQFGLIDRGFRPNALLLSLADALAPSLSQGLAVAMRNLLIARFTTSWSVTLGEVAGIVNDDGGGFGRWLKTWLQHADLGVDNYEVQPAPTLLEQEPPSRGSRKRARPTHRLMLIHRGINGTLKFPNELESHGTRRFIELSPIFYDLMHGDRFRAMFVDELDASLHPQLLEGLLRDFNEIPPDSVNGQLVFACHETSLFDHEAKDAVLRRDQIYLTEKDANGSARLYSLADFSERNNLNLRKRYLEGRYGALPSLGRLGD